MNRTFN